MLPTRYGFRLLIALACLASGCASSEKYPFREKPVPPTARETPAQADAAHIELEKELSYYSD